MSFIQQCCKRPLVLALMAMSACGGESAFAQDLKAMSLPDLISYAQEKLFAGRYDEALPALQEALSDTERQTDENARTASQACRIEIARILYQQGNIAAGLGYVEDYLDNTPRPQERRALSMLAQGFFEDRNWEKIVELYDRLKDTDLDEDVRLNMNLLAGQAFFQTKKYAESIEPLRNAERNSKDDRIKAVCQVMLVLCRNGAMEPAICVGAEFEYHGPSLRHLPEPHADAGCQEAL